MRAAIVGVGAIGGALAGFLDQAGGHELILCTRRPLPRLIVSFPDIETRVRARNATIPAQAGPVDWVIAATFSTAPRSWSSATGNGRSTLPIA